MSEELDINFEGLTPTEMAEKVLKQALMSKDETIKLRAVALTARLEALKPKEEEITLEPELDAIVRLIYAYSDTYKISGVEVINGITDFLHGNRQFKEFIDERTVQKPNSNA